MKQNIKKYIGFIAIALFFVACDDWTEIQNNELQKPLDESPKAKSEDYYANLRAYKKSDHQIAFGWFGYWTGMGPSSANMLKSVPDSMDIVSIWGDYHPMTPEKIEDMRYVQEKLGTRVTFTIFAHQIPQPFDSTPEKLAQYAKALSDSINKYGFDGLDLDYEPGYGGVGPLINQDTMQIFVEALAKYLGPKSGTGKLLLLDGVSDHLNPGVWENFDYMIVQAYDAASDYGMQTGLNRWEDAHDEGWPPERYIPTENFEKNWRTGGMNYQTTINGKTTTIPSLLGMAHWQPYITETPEGGGPNINQYYRKGGAGAYHMEYEYNQPENGGLMEYQYMRQMIQMMNPADSIPTPVGKVNKPN